MLPVLVPFLRHNIPSELLIFQILVQTCYQSDQSDERLQIDLSEAIVRSNLFNLFAKTRVVKSNLIDLDKIELSEFKLT
jgi:hypothetical protein